ncbi:MAG TPA: I78 family peptidase inhibitor [Moraxellaceae bacterium]
MRFPAVTLPALLLLLSACSSRPATGSDGLTLCDARRIQWTVGQIADAPLLARARQESGADQVRILDINSIVTLEHDDHRLNLRVDVNNKVEFAMCG